ncbi:helix-turn-helix transcriptional regulator [Paenarthrobacter nitroguajacolicus]|uniref:helix-turn-helix transcriptional regulator n=1 Tax=Paenarthrobacter nitroguajacolicus TaxID=211146 RepID=UPI003AE9EC29
MGTVDLPWIRRIAAVASLGDENRRRLYEYVLDARDAVGRDEAALALELPRSSASFHMDRLVRDGLLQVEFRKPPHKTGPGSGRPSKLYRPVAEEIGVSIPERNYDLAGHLMAAAIKRAEIDGSPVGPTLREVADAKGSELGRPGDFLGALSELGYEPSPDDSGGYRLLNCPFHRLSREHKEVVCGMNGALLGGVAAASGLRAEEVVPDPEHGPGHCCARIALIDNGSQATGT